MSAENFDWRKHIIECMQSTNYCSIATVDPKGVWSNPVYFAWDEKLNIYFISQLSSRHMQNMQKNSKIAISIYKTEQKGDIVGIQLEGRAHILSEHDGKSDIQHAFDVYYGRAGHGTDVQSYINNPTWLYVKVTPEQIYYFDTRFFEEERQLVPIDTIQ